MDAIDNSHPINSTDSNGLPHHNLGTPRKNPTNLAGSYRDDLTRSGFCTFADGCNYNYSYHIALLCLQYVYVNMTLFQWPEHERSELPLAASTSY